MSLIHEALQKLEEETKNVPNPEVSEPAERQTTPLSESPLLSAKPSPPEKKSKVVFGIGAVLGFFFILGLGYLFLASRDKTDSQPEFTGAAEVSRPPAPPLPVSSRRQGPFHLTGISRSGSDWTAIINNELVRVGEAVNGAEVKEIRSQEVILDFKGQTLTLSLY
ncbi:MAG: hypothetical protein HYU34_05610 [Candidatus Omnitrophica bacterium]|nr:hypothetical protein [Candidatus Omnitrophota bacterium]